MQRKKIIIGVIASVVITSTATIGVVLAERVGRGYQTPEEIGAYFHFGNVGPKSFVPGITRSEAEAAAVQRFLTGFDLPPGIGIEEGVLRAATTGEFSGAKGGYGAWNVYDRDVWVVVLSDLPISLPCGPGLCKGMAPPRFSVAIDATTGEVLTSETAGGGPLSSKWDAVVATAEAGRLVDPTPPTPTPVGSP